MSIVLSPRERAELKARAHALEPVAQVGQAGLSDSFVSEVDRALKAHALIKVKLGAADRDARAALSHELAERTASAEVQHVGKVVVLWRPKPDDAA
jgi:putative YhbY family RNA-binding protein